MKISTQRNRIWVHRFNALSSDGLTAFLQLSLRFFLSPCYLRFVSSVTHWPHHHITTTHSISHPAAYFDPSPMKIVSDHSCWLVAGYSVVMNVPVNILWQEYSFESHHRWTMSALLARKIGAAVEKLSMRKLCLAKVDAMLRWLAQFPFVNCQHLLEISCTQRDMLM